MMTEEGQMNCFFCSEDHLLSPEKLASLNQTLITPDLAVAFGIKPSHSPPPSSNTPPPLPSSSFGSSPSSNPHPLPPSSSAGSPPSSNAPPLPPSSSSGSSSLNPPTLPPSSNPDSPRPDEPARTPKRPRLAWTPDLHKRFVDAVDLLGMEKAVPKTIMRLMGVEGLTREKVASHLQKYRLYLKRMDFLNRNRAASTGAGQPPASVPALHHFLHWGGRMPYGEHGMEHSLPFMHGMEHYLPFMPIEKELQHHRHQMAGTPLAAAVLQQYFQQYQHHMGLSGLPAGGQFKHELLAQQQLDVHWKMPSPASESSSLAYVENLEPVAGEERKLLKLFPTGDD